MLVQTSAALQTAQAAGDREQGGAEVVDEANDRMMEIDRQQEMMEAQTSFSVPVNVTAARSQSRNGSGFSRPESMAANFRPTNRK